jgi:hypothetical protein
VKSLDSADTEQDGDGKTVDFDRFAIYDDKLVDDTNITSRPTSFAALAIYILGKLASWNTKKTMTGFLLTKLLFQSNTFLHMSFYSCSLLAPWEYQSQPMIPEFEPRITIYHLDILFVFDVAT